MVGLIWLEEGAPPSCTRYVSEWTVEIRYDAADRACSRTVNGPKTREPLRQSGFLDDLQGVVSQGVVSQDVMTPFCH